MATITSVQSGNWSDGATWLGGVAPVPADDVVIAAGHTVMLTGDTNPQKALTINGKLDIGDFILTLGTAASSSVFSDYLFTFGPGGELTGSGTVIPRCGKMRSTATADNWARVTGSLSFEAWAGANKGRNHYELQYVSFQTTGVQRFPCDGGATGIGGHYPSIAVKHCTFAGCSFVGFGSTNTRADTDFDIRNCDFRDCGEIRMSGQNTANDAGRLRNFIDCTVYYSAQKTSWVPYVPGPWNFRGTTLINCTCGTNRSADIYTECFLSNGISNTNANVLMNTMDGSRAERCVLHNAPVPPSDNNPHLIVVAELVDCFIEVRGSEPNAHIANTAHTAMRTEGCIMIGNGDLINTTVTTPKNWLGRNNTLVTHSTEITNALALVETNPMVPLSTGMLLRNNLQVCLAAAKGGSYLCRSTGPNFPVDADYNAQYNMSGLFRPGVPIVNGNVDNGAHNLTIGDPLFVDPTRTPETWAAMILSKPNADHINLYDLMLRKNGYDAGSKTQKAALIAPAGVPEMLAWLREGYTPQNMALAEAGEGGAYIGAVMPKESGGEPAPDPTGTTPADAVWALTTGSGAGSATVGNGGQFILRIGQTGFAPEDRPTYSMSLRLAVSDPAGILAVSLADAAAAAIAALPAGHGVNFTGGVFTFAGSVTGFAMILRTATKPDGDPGGTAVFTAGAPTAGSPGARTTVKISMRAVPLPTPGEGLAWGRLRWE